MSNVLKVSNPVPGYENNVKNNPYTTADTQVQAPIDPSKVLRPDQRQDAGRNQDNAAGFRYESNYDNFVQMLKELPQLTEQLKELFFNGMGMEVKSGVGENFAVEIAQFMEMLQMNPEELKTFLKGQTESSVRYQGPFFELMRQVLSETKSVDLKSGILEFAKRYNDMASGSHILESVKTNLDAIGSRIMSGDRGVLNELAQRLNFGAAPGDTLHNAQVLKQEILPFLSEYIGKTHDMGTVRGFISLLTYNTARYENGNMDNLLNTFQKLLGFPAFERKFGSLDAATLREVLGNMDYSRQGRAGFAERLVSVIRQGLSGGAGAETKQVFEGVMNSVLLNESVYMPMLHVMLPLELNGQLMFSEMWIDPDDDGGSDPADDTDGRRVKLLIKLDIQQVGFFDIILLYQNGKVDLQVYYPERLRPLEKGIYEGLASIISQNGMECASLNVEKSGKPKTLTEVFPKINERKNTVNVRI